MLRLRLMPENPNFPFMAWRRRGFTFSAVLMVASVILYLTMGHNYGIDFRGGILMEIGTDGPADLAEIRAELGGLGLGDVRVQSFDDDNHVLIRIERQPGGEEMQQLAITAIKNALAASYGDSIDYRRTEAVGPAVGKELKSAGLQAVIYALLAMMVYIWFRFEWQFSIGAVTALAHDVIATIGLFAATQMVFDLATVAAILLIVGYSMNDTVVVYDRVRENLRKYRKLGLEALLSRSINDTLSRTIMTSVTTLLALTALWILGGPVIRDFCFAMIWGVLIGTYSSIFIAAPLLIRLGLENITGGDRAPDSGPRPQELPPAGE